MKGSAIGLVVVGSGLLAVTATSLTGNPAVSGKANSVANRTAPGSVPARYERLFNAWGNECDAITPSILAAQLKQESGFNPKAKSPVGAMGIAQFMPGTWKNSGFDGNKDGKKDVWDPEDAIPSAAKYMCSVSRDVKDVPGDKTRLALAGYNAGPRAVQKYRGIPPYKETENYVSTIMASAAKMGQAVGGQSNVAVEAVNYASAQIGKDYVWGGNGDADGGFDCSGLTKAAYAQAGVTLPRVASAQYTHLDNDGSLVEKSDLRIGDLVFFSKKKQAGKATPADIDHVGIYIGRGHFLNAPRTGAKVRIEKIWWGTYMGAGRVYPKSTKTKEV
ncbi:NlpC/P60 family protein [Streptomyces sp. NBC_01283]|uniref:C40 family peptidase n=1 Tax=Streptomyces sp. NBC_01283 TaxID=2903812 RepID=UPI00352DEAF1